MAALHPLLANPLAHGVFWSAVTIGLYLLAKRVYRRWGYWWLMPMALTPVLVGVVVVALHAGYGDYISGTRWLVLLLGPATVAFAIPIYEHRQLIRAQWPVLLLGMIAGSVTAVASSWALASLLGLNGVLRLSLLPRSISTPFAMEVSGDIGGVPELTAVFVIVTGVVGAVIGDVLLARVPLRSALARGALFGIAAHGAGTARAHQIGATEGAVSGLVMVLVGLMNVLVAPLVMGLLQ
ncbi:LrgB family protein [Pseudodonghicola flavimaris]|uniref:LrgB family protein n=1 Tax=Pseudodonghicola flavimaris TaxID=3050036 RepID=A0ABT7F2Q1_9RHOB|nr:LrgB family protein [Pseudodonghicola flavimaris]MDK3018867.1 LrgB family protein [Pseudodonghicola flavimaris]